jgi:GNAT superfamily N-acetyltransferase
MKRLVVSWTPNSIKKTGMASDAGQMIEDVLYRYYRGKAQVEKLGRKGPVTFWKDPEKDPTFFLTHVEAPLPIGMLFCQNIGKGVLESNMSWVHPEFQGQGLGLQMYEAAIANLGQLASSVDLSVGSSYIWRKLSEKYKVTFIVESKGKKEIKIVGWEVLKNITYPIFLDAEGNKVRYSEELKRSKRESHREFWRAIQGGYYLARK